MSPADSVSSMTRQSLAVFLREEPMDQRWFGVGPLPDVVVHARVFGRERVSAGFPSGCDAVARERDGNGLVGVAVEIPERRLEGVGAVVFLGGAAAGNCGCEESGTSSDDVPGSGTSHGLAGDVDAAVIDGELFADGVNYF